MQTEQVGQFAHREIGSECKQHINSPTHGGTAIKIRGAVWRCSGWIIYRVFSLSSRRSWSDERCWTGLVVSGLNSLIVCVIGLHTSQYGFIPANVFCICINAFNLRTWLKAQKYLSELTTDASSELVAGCKRMSTSKNAATRRLRNSFRIRSEGRLGNSISSLAVKGVWPFATTPLRTNTNVGVPTLDV